MLILLTLGVMGGVAYAHFREGLFTAVTTLVNVFLAGLLTFNFFEPLARTIGGLFRGSFLSGYEDFLAIVVLFCALLFGLRTLTIRYNGDLIEFPPAVQQFGAAFVGLLAGYLLAGILICAFETLPWGQHFLGFEPRGKDESPLRRVLPPDRVWLAMMHRAGQAAFSRGELPPDQSTGPDDTHRTFDRFGTFESSYLHFRRTRDQ
ncbi:MAG: CvpA family protein [Gemmataceae bacterium]|nr:CvpA family protein [Gemmataceae bacterium]